MKKTRFITLVLVAAMMLVGAGYAYWSDTLQVNNTVDTGKLEVGFVEDSKHPFIENVDYVDTEAGRANFKTAIFEVSDLYPGEEVTYQVEVENTGTIPAVFDDAVVKFEKESNKLFNNLRGKFGQSYGSASLVNMKDLKESINDNLAGLRIEPGEKKVLKASFKLPGEVGNHLEEQDLTVKLTLNWTQHNDPAVAK